MAVTTLPDLLLTVSRGELVLPGRAVDKLRVFWDFAIGLSSLSCCKRAGVGCLVVTQDLSRVLAVGYNGPAAGVPNDSCRGIEGACGCSHAEGNAMAKLGGEERGLVLLTTTLQCEHCAGLVVNSRRVSYVVYGKPYRDPAGEKLLRRAGLIVVGIDQLLK